MGRRAVVLIFIVVLGGAAHAQNRDKARELFLAAQNHYKLGEFEQALDGFKEAYRNFEEPSLLFNIALCERQLGHKQEALRSYRMFLSEVPDATNRAEVEKIIAVLEQAIKDDAARPEPQPPPRADKVASAPPVAPPPTIEKRRHTWWMVGLGGGLLAVGAAGIGTGAGALAVDGRGSCSPAPGQVRCPQRYDTLGEGGALVGVGLASAIVGAVLLAVEARRYHAPLHAHLGLWPSGRALVLSGAF